MLRPQPLGSPSRPTPGPWGHEPMLLTTAALIALMACAGPWQPPTPGPMIRPFAAPSQAFGAGHRGVDFASEVGDPVSSPTEGTVTLASTIGGRPVLVVTDEAGRRATLEPVTALVSVGDRVRAGEPVGVLGRGGHCDGRCLHLGVRVDAPGQRPAYLPPLDLLGCRAILKPDP